MKTHLVELTGSDPSGSLTVYRFATAGYSTAPTDTPANTYFEPRVARVPEVTRAMFRDGQTSGEGQIGFGVLELLNPDGGLDGLVDLGFDGWPCRIWVGDTSEPFSTFSLVLEGTAEQPVFDDAVVQIHLRDASQALDVALQTNRYAGNNVLPAGVEGTESDLKGQPKPLVYGSVLNMAPPMVNTSMLVFQVNDGPVDSIAVFDSRVALSNVGDEADVSALLSATGSGGEYSTCLAQGLFRLHGAPIGQVTADVEEANDTLGKVITAIVARSTLSVSASDISQLETDAPWKVGLVFDSQITVAQALSEVTSGVGVYVVPDSTGVVRAGLLTVPAAPNDIEIERSQVLELRRIVPRDTDRGIPAHEVVVSYARCWHTMTRDQLAGASESDIALVGQRHRTAIGSDSDVLDQYPLASVIERTTSLVLAADAQAAADRLQAMYGSRRDIYRVLVAVDTAELGDVVLLKHPRYGMAAGRLFRVLGIETQAQPGQLYLTLWG